MSFRERLVDKLRFEFAIETFYRVATGSRRQRTLLTPVGLLIFFSLIGLFMVVSLQGDKLLGLPKLLPASLSVLISVPVIALGLFLMLWSNWHFIKVKGTGVPFNPPPKLVTTGPYKYVRNPMITGVFILLFGLGILLRSISLVFIFAPLFVLLSVLELIAIEEPELEKRLGKEYIEYRERVPMFIPRLKIRSEDK